MIVLCQAALRTDQVPVDYVSYIAGLASSSGIPILFTEAGTASYPGANDRLDFHDSDIAAPGTATDYQEQVNWYESFFETWGVNTPSWLKGVFFWDNNVSDVLSYTTAPWFSKGYDME